MVVSLASLFLGGTWQTAAQGCGTVLALEFKTISTNRWKQGVPGFLDGTNQYGNINIYRRKTENTTNQMLFENVTSSTNTMDVRTSVVHDYYYSNRFESGVVQVSCGPVNYEYPATLTISGVDDRTTLTQGGSEPPKWKTRSVLWSNGTETVTLVCKKFVDDAWVTDDPPVWYWNEESTCTLVTNSSQITDDVMILDRVSYQGTALIGTNVLDAKLENFCSTDELETNTLADVMGGLGGVSQWSCSSEASFSLSQTGRCASMTAGKYRYSYLGPQGVTNVFKFRITTTANYYDGSSTNVSFELTRTNVTTGTVQFSEQFDFFAPFEGGKIVSSTLTVTYLGQTECAATPGVAQSNYDLEHGVFVTFGLNSCPNAAFLYLQLTDLNAFTHSLASVGLFGRCHMQIEVDEDDESMSITTSAVNMNVVAYVDSIALVYPNNTFTITKWQEGQDIRLRIEENPSGNYAEYKQEPDGMIYFDAGDGVWSEAWGQTTDGEGRRLSETSLVKATDGTTLFSEFTEYTVIEGLAESQPSTRTIGTGAEAQQGFWFYKDDVPSTNANYGKLALAVGSDGSWQHFDYNATNGLVTNVVSAFANAATNASSSDVRQTHFLYSSFHPYDTNSLEPLTPRVTHERIKGELVRMHGVALWANNRLEIEFHSSLFGTAPSSMWNNAANLKTLTTDLTLTNGTGTRVILPDGTVSFSFSVTNTAGDYRTNISMTGAPDNASDPTTVTDGTQSIMVTRVSDNKTITSTSYDVTPSRTAVTSQETFSYFGTGNNSYTVTYLDGSTATYNYSDCCRLLSSVVGRDKVATEYLYDVRKRQFASLRLGILTSNVLDNAGNVLETWRVPISDWSKKIRVNASVYDTAGRLRSSADALNRTNTTSFSVAGDGRTITTTTNPDGSWTQEYRNRDGSLDRTIGTATFPVAYSYGVDATTKEPYTEERKLDAAGDPTSEWTRSYTDCFGRSSRAVAAAATGQNNPETISAYNSLGQQSGVRDADTNWTYFAYDARGGQRDTWVDQGSASRTNRTESAIVDLVDGATYTVRRTLSYQVPLGATADYVSMTTLDGLRSWNVSFGITNKTVRTLPNASGEYTVTTTAADGSYSVSSFQWGRLLSVYRYASGGGSALQGATYDYDLHGRQWKVTDSRNGATTFALNNADQVLAVTNPPPAAGQSAPVTQTEFDLMGRATNVIYPDLTSVATEFYAHGLPKKTTGSRAYPVQYGYDDQGRMTTLTTWQNYPGSGAADTTWQFDPYRGQLSGKTYAGNTPGPGYTHSSGGRLLTRTWARGITTRYTNNAAGQLTGVSYTGATASSVVYTFDSRGRPDTVTRGTEYAATRLFDDAGRLLSERYTAGPLNGLTVSNRYDSLGRRATNGLWNGTTWLAQTHYLYDSAGRLQAVIDPLHSVSAGYSYLANSPLIEYTYFTNGSTRVMTTSRSYDGLNRLTKIESINNQPSTISSSSYLLNAANQRLAVTNVDGSRWAFDYDNLGQVISGKKFWTNNTPAAGEQFEYTFDTIGNRTQTKAGGDQNGANLRTASYVPTLLNQYTNRTVPGYLPVTGSAHSNAIVTVNGTVAGRQGEYFWRELTVNNGSSPVWQGITNVGVLNQQGSSSIRTIDTGSMFVPQTTEIYNHDADGNLLGDGHWNYTWDVENRLVKMETVAAAYAAGAPHQAIVFVYDDQSRRIQKVVSNYVAGAWSLTSDQRFVYDGWNLIAVLTSDLGLLTSFTWGLDLSGSLQGAGGVGGLLSVYDSTTINNQPSTHFACFDGNGNVMALINAADSSPSAQYEYGPFGELIRATGPMAKANPLRFSTKYQDDESDLLYYGYRSYNPQAGRWLSRDPIAEKGSLNLYGFVYNKPIRLIDTLGEAVLPPDFIGPPNQDDFYGTPIPDPNNPGNDRADRERYAREVMNQFADFQWRNPDKCCKLDACSLAAQWMAESNWGRSGLAKDAKNLGGIKGSGPAGSYNATTKEIENGTEVQIKDNFRAYHNYPEFYADYANLICKANRYGGARGRKGREYYEALKQSGYSTDPTYANKMMQFYRQLGCK